MSYTIKSFVLVGLAFILTSCGGSPSGGSSPGSSSGGGSGTSTAGSTSTMLKHGSALYILDGSGLSIMNLDTQPIERVGSKRSRFSTYETLFIADGHLYIGGTRGVDILDISDPFEPVLTSTYEHLTSCDPVIVEDGIGYVTLRASLIRCPRGPERLEIVDFSDPAFPALIADYEMPNPYGLAKTPDYLAICQEQLGMSLLNVMDPQNVGVVNEYPDIHCFDLIYTGENLIATASNGIFQFYAGETELIELSRIPVGESTQ